jgi:hypothetical protein
LLSVLPAVELPVSVAAVFPNTLLEVEVTVFEASTTELL